MREGATMKWILGRRSAPHCPRMRRTVLQWQAVLWRNFTLQCVAGPLARFWGHVHPRF